LQPGPHVRGTPGAEPGPGVLCRRRFAAATWFAVASQASAGANQRRCPEAIGLSSTECSGERIFSVAAARAACYAMHVRGPPPPSSLSSIVVSQHLENTLMIRFFTL